MKNKIARAVLFVIVLTFGMAIRPVLAAPLSAPARITIDWAALLDTLVATYWPLLAILIGAVVADVGLGVGAALRTKTYQWSRLADFYKTDVLPMLMGWMTASVAVYIVSPHLVSGPLKDILSVGTVGAAWTVIMAHLGASIGKSFKELFGVSLPLQTPGKP